ncbi:hypothetical protein L1F30_13400 [Simiduia sp. 21SJ11W-1]|uniref:hypothetical protein n=1 Tax=Simiduia sp. 21SJ11W-1 TaxID=2909669 RepID=UPI00209CBD13|nr:hypothetical protein [Simiduia sp. 21SJ11W-1]UTA47153.1 hypothetical protein L1F30_13400 [Simiduia sp. 21SJ11W-1]
MKIILILLIALYSLAAVGHEDTIIKRDGDILIGLPSDYQPAIFVESKLELRLGSKSVTFPKCMKELFALKGDEIITLHASWYHGSEPGGLPPYISLQKSSHPYDFEKHLLINMDTLHPIDTGFSYGLQEDEKKCLKEFKPRSEK